MPGFLFGAVVVHVSEFFSRVLPHVLGCPDPLAAQAVVDSARLLCEGAMMLREALDPMAVVAGVAEYDVDAPSSQVRVLRVLGARLDDSALIPVARADFGEPVLPDGTPTHFSTRAVSGALSVRLYPLPVATGELVLDVAVGPARAATQLDDELFDRWVDVVAAGAVYRLASVVGQPFSDPAKAAAAQAAFVYGARRARIEGGFGQLVSARTVAPRPFV